MKKQSDINAVIASADGSWRDQMARALAQSGCTCALFADGLSAVAELRRRPYEVAVADASIPDLGLIEFCFHVRDLHGRKPVVLIVGEGVDTHMSRFRSMQVYADSDRAGILEMVPKAVDEARRTRNRQAGFESLSS